MKNLTFLLLFFIGNYSYAATKNWDGGAGTVNWEVANNWSGNTIPSPGDSVIIKNETVELSTTQSIRSLRIEDGTSAHLTITKYGVLTVAGGGGAGVLLIGDSKLSILGRLNISNCLDGLIASAGQVELLGGTSRIDISLVTGNGIFTGGTVLNEGLISVNDASDYGWQNVGAINNVNQILIVTTGSDGFQHSGASASFINANSASFTIENANSRGLNCESYFLNQGLLQIENTYSSGISNYGNSAGFINSGDLNIYYAGVDAIKNWGTGSKFTNLSQGNIYNSYAGSSGIFTSNFFQNQGDIEIHHCGLSLYNLNNTDTFFNSGNIIIRTSGRIQNKDSGAILKNQSGGVIDFVGTSTLLNKGKLINEGTLKLRGAGIENSSSIDSLINKGLIQIDLAIVGLLNTAGIGVNSVFKNDINGTVNIDSCSNISVYNEQVIINKGSMSLSNSFDYCLSNPRRFENYGSISLFNSMGSDALNNVSANSVFVNHLGSQLHINTSANTGILTYRKFKNEGDILIEKSATYGINLIDIQDTLYNSGNLTINNSGTYAIRNAKSGISPGIILNDIGGSINIDSTGAAGIFNALAFENKGSIEIKRSKANGIQNLLTFQNDGQISIIDADIYSLNNTFSGIFENNISGNILIDSSNNKGVINYGRFLNNGRLNIKHTEDYAIHNVASSDSLINNGIITIDSSKLGLNNISAALFKIGALGQLIIQNIDSIGLGNQGVMHSEPCSQVYLKNAVLNTEMYAGYDSELKGLFYYHNPRPDKITEYFEVDGVTVDVFWNLNKNTNFQSRTNVFSPLGRVSNGIKEVNIVKDYPTATYDISSTWWANRNKTTSAGFYDEMDKTFLPNAAGAISDSLFFEIAHKTVGCKNVVALPSKNDISCVNNIYSVSFLGIASDQWLNTSNWPTYYQLPNACTKVTIPANKKAVIPTDFKVRVHSIETIPTSVLDIASGAVFEVDITK
jgi:hypothetical protein